MFVEEPLELDVGGAVVLVVVDVFDGSGVSVLVCAGVLVDVDVGTGGLLEELEVDVGAELDDEGAGVPGAEDCESVGRAMSRFAASVPSRWASNAFAAAAAAAVFES